MNILLMSYGTCGELHPFMGLAAVLRRRAHHVAVAANEYFQPLIDRAGLEFLPMGTTGQYRQSVTNPALWTASQCIPAVLGDVARFLRPMYKIAADFARRDNAAVITSTFALGARVAQDHLGLPLVTTHIAPSQIQSAYDSVDGPAIVQPVLSNDPGVRARQLFQLNDQVDAFVLPALNSLRSEMGLAPVRGVLSDYCHSPRRVIAFFPEWFAPRQPDTPPQVRYAGFPCYDESGVTPMSALLEEFLAQGPPPIAFTPGTGMWIGQRFFQTAIGACAALGRRGVLLSRHDEHIPRPLPPGVIHADYAPFSQLLPRCAALVHHGGIGSCAAAMAAGTPQLITPFAFDQHDNANRLVRLGVAHHVSTADFVPGNVIPVLQDLLASPSAALACRQTMRRFENIDPTGTACDLIEAVQLQTGTPP